MRPTSPSPPLERSPPSTSSTPSGAATVVAGLPPEDLGDASAALIEDEAARRNDPARLSEGRPRQPVRRWRLRGQRTARWPRGRCLRVSGSESSRAGRSFGILQSDQVGGTDLHDLQRAVFHGYGVQFSAGSLTPNQLRRLLTAGYGAVIQGVYGEIPAPAVASSRASPAATRSTSTASTRATATFRRRTTSSIRSVAAARTAAAGGRRRSSTPSASHSAAVRGSPRRGSSRRAARRRRSSCRPTSQPLPPDAGDGTSPSPGASPGPSASDGAGEEPGTVSPPAPDLPATDRSGDDRRPRARPVPDHLHRQPGARRLSRAACEGVFELPPAVFTLPIGPTIEVKFVDSDRPNIALIGFTVDSARARRRAVLGGRRRARDDPGADIDGEPRHPRRADDRGRAGRRGRDDVSLPDRGRRRALRLDEPGRDVHDRVRRAALRGGAEQQWRTRCWTSNRGFSPYLHLADGALAPPLLEMVGGERGQRRVGGRVIDFGGADPYCLADIGAAEATCQTVNVDLRPRGDRRQRRPDPGVPDDGRGVRERVADTDRHPRGGRTTGLRRGRDRLRRVGPDLLDRHRRARRRRRDPRRCRRSWCRSRLRSPRLTRR